MAIDVPCVIFLRFYLTERDSRPPAGPSPGRQGRWYSLALQKEGRLFVTTALIQGRSHPDKHRNCIWRGRAGGRTLAMPPQELDEGRDGSLFFPIIPVPGSPNVRTHDVQVGIFCSGNMPACSKHDLLRKWPKPKDIRDVATFIAFGMFYMRMRWIPWFEM